MRDRDASATPGNRRVGRGGGRHPPRYHDPTVCSRRRRGGTGGVGEQGEGEGGSRGGRAESQGRVRRSGGGKGFLEREVGREGGRGGVGSGFVEENAFWSLPSSAREEAETGMGGSGEGGRRRAQEGGDGLYRLLEALLSEHYEGYLDLYHDFLEERAKMQISFLTNINR